MLNQPHSVTVEDLGITIETGAIAKQAGGAVTITLGESTLFVAATAASSVRPGQDYFPLSVDYREKFSAAGRFPGGYFKREGRPSEREVLTSRLCDRPLRPLFPNGFMNEVQVIGLLLTTDLTNDPDILMVNAASAALMISDIPWNGPVGCVRIGEINGEFVVNPTNEQQFESNLDLVYVGNEKEMMMIEGSGDQIPDERFIEALEFAQVQVEKIIAAQHKLTESGGKAKKEFTLYKCDPEFLSAARDFIGTRLDEAVFRSVRQERDDAVAAVRTEVEAQMIEKIGEEDYNPDQLSMAFETLQEEVYRRNILESNRRVDGRGAEEIRPIVCTAGILPRVHGSALFQRGETQTVAIATLGTTSDSQDMDGLTGGAKSKSFVLHYNFPPYSVGETGRFFGPGRREIGHGALAERSLLPVCPTEEEFPYTVRLVSEIMESNGSSSMASVCGGCLALMDAGVPITDMVAGISTGLVTSADESGKIEKYVVLTDIIGSEDHFGDMDFKISGTRKGITGFQLDLKINGLPFDIAKEGITRNRDARLSILDSMSAEIAEPRAELNENAPRVHQMKIDPEKIGAVIGPGGKTIRRITEVSGADVDINEDNSGRLMIYATSHESMQRAIEEIEIATGDIEVGKTYRGIVRSIKEFGCFVECLPGKEGLVHISELADFRVNRTEDVCAIGDEMWVKCVDVDDRGRVRLSRRMAMAEREAIEKGEPIPEYTPPERPEPRQRRDDRRGDRSRGDGRDRDRGRDRERGERGRRGDGGSRQDRHRDRPANRSEDRKNDGENRPSETQVD